MIYASFFFLLTLLSVVVVNGDRRAQWMSGRWGIGYRIHASEYMIGLYDVDQFITQLRTIKGNPSYVIVNLSGPANGGDIYLSHNPTLWSIGNTLATPALDGRDLFQELLDALRGEGLKVIAYMAAQGPALLKSGMNKAHDFNGTASPALDNWVEYVETTYGTRPDGDDSHFYEAYATDIVAYYANKFGSQIDGWWFDQGTSCDRALLEAACHGANPDSVVALNYGQKNPLKVNSPGLEDYTFGHPTPLRSHEPSSIVNLGMVTSVENSNDGWISDADGNEVMSHLFMPMANTWNSINYIQADGTDRFYNTWEKDQAVDWMSRVLESGGAWTWNIPRESNAPNTLSILRPDFVAFLNEVADELPLLCPDDVCDDAGDYWNVCIVMDIKNQYGSCQPKDGWAFIYESDNYCGPCEGGYCSEIPKETDPCDDAQYCEFMVDSSIWRSENCAWLREQSDSDIDIWCEKLDTREMCPETCGICSDSCEDSSGTILIDGVEESCSFLAISPDLHAEFCDSNHSSGAWTTCAETCGNCNAEYISNVWSPLDCSDHVCDNAGNFWSACVVMEGVLNQYNVCLPPDAWVFVYESDNYCGSCDGYCAETAEESDPCDDAHYCEFTVDSVTLESRSCYWLRQQDGPTISQWCQKVDTQEICPETCGICADMCVDDATPEIIDIEGTAQGCDYLAANPDLRSEICDPSHSSDAWTICAETCGNCDAVYIEL